MGKLGVTIFVCLSILDFVLSDAGYFTPKAYYVIDKNGEKSDVVYLTPRVKREIFDKLHVIRKRDANDIAKPKCDGLNTKVQIADGSSYSGAGAGGYAGPPFGFPQFGPFGPYFGAGSPDEFRKQFEAAFSQYPGPPPFNNDENVQQLAGRFGGGEELSQSGELDNVPGVSVSSSAQGPHGAYSSSSTSVDSNGKAKYNTRSGKF